MSSIETDATVTGLTEEQVLKQRSVDGTNELGRERNLLLVNLVSVVKEPMFILLVVTCVIYFSLREYAEAFTMLAALMFVAGIDVFQSYRSQKAVKALSKLTASKCKVIRSGEEIEIDARSLVTEDVIICEEGTIIPADAEIINSNDFAVNEAIMTGESAAVEKFAGEPILQGTLVVRGYCTAKVLAVGQRTALSELGQLVSETDTEKTPLQLKVGRFVRLMVYAGSTAFLFVWGYNWWKSGDIIHGLLHGLTMAMSVLPEEIPVALSTFMALGAYRLLKVGVIARGARSVEALGAATVICVDKTGTLTRNLMDVAYTFHMQRGETDFRERPEFNNILEYAMWSSEENPFDPMEMSIHKHYGALAKIDERRNFRMVKEFPLAGSPPVMTHMFRNNEDEFRVACKGGLEGVLALCTVEGDERAAIIARGRSYAGRGYRVLGVAKGTWKRDQFPSRQEEIAFEFLGIIAFLDPLGENIPAVIEGFYGAGVNVKMITGDYEETAVAIAREAGLRYSDVASGNDIAKMSEDGLVDAVAKVDVFARVNPETKLRIVNALKKRGEIVAMTGDGVNDAPALKAAHIGIAMGQRGTEVAKGAAGLILTRDDLSTMIDAIYMGRRINENLIKAIRYIISIHIPIILLVTLPIFIGWLPAMLFAPVHVVFLELIMGPTCSIVYENEPIPRAELEMPMRSEGKSLISGRQLTVTILQGLMVTVGTLVSGYIALSGGADETIIRTWIFTTLILSNVFLTLVNRSFHETVITTIKRRNYLLPLVILISLGLLAVILWTPLGNRLFLVNPPDIKGLWIPALIAFAFTMWVEPFKAMKTRWLDKLAPH